MPRLWTLGNLCRRRPWGTLESPPSKAAGSDFVGFTPWLSFDTPGRNPEHARGRDGIDSPSLPPGDFVSEAMVVAVMASAQGYRELIAHLASHCAELGEPQVVGISGASSTDQARLRCHEFEVGFVAMPARLADRKLAFLDFGGSGIGLKMRRWWRGIISDD